MAALPRAVAPLRHARYRWLAASLALSLLHTGLWAVAVVWQVVAMDGGPAQLSLVTALSAGGMLASTLLGGALADRLPQRHILLGVALTQALSVAVAAALSLAGQLALWHLAAVSLVGGLATGLYYPAYSALVPALVPARDLLAVNGLEGVVRPLLSQAGGPAIAGLLVAALSPGMALAAAAVAALGAAACVAALQATPVRAIRTPRPPACSPTCERASGTWCGRRGCWRRWCSRRSCCWSSSGRSRWSCPSPSRTREAAPASTPGSWAPSGWAVRSDRWPSPPGGCPAAI